jgi:hypothetical protein
VFGVDLGFSLHGLLAQQSGSYFGMLNLPALELANFKDKTNITASKIKMDLPDRFE